MPVRGGLVLPQALVTLPGLSRRSLCLCASVVKTPRANFLYLFSTKLLFQSSSKPRKACGEELQQLPQRRMSKMKNRAVVALFVAVMFALPALAQQPAASTPQDNSSQAAGTNATGKAPLQYES